MALRVSTPYRRPRSSAVTIFESWMPGMYRSGSSPTAAATTGPARQPRPTSSTPAMRWNPKRRKAFSRVRIARTLTMGSYCALLVSFILAAFPFSSRRKYSFARRTRADRTTSTLAIVGECSGKMRSTPWPNETLRTVNDARAPPRCRPMMIPSKIWMRSLSPSRTLTCTRTVSPDFIRGRSANCDFSISSIALISRLPLLRRVQKDPAFIQDFLEQFAVLVVERRLLDQLRPPIQRPRQRGLPAPPPNVSVMPREQHVGHFHSRELHRPCVVRVVQQPPRE